MTEPNQEIKEAHYLAPLLAQLDYLTKKIEQVHEVQCKRKDRYILHHERRKPKENKNKCVEYTLLIILQKDNEHDRVLEDLKENVTMLYQMIGSHSRSIHLIETSWVKYFLISSRNNKRGCLVIQQTTPRMRFKWGLALCHNFNKGDSQEATEDPLLIYFCLW